MNDREALIEDRREAEQALYVLTTLEQAELAGLALERFCATFLTTWAMAGVSPADRLRLLQEALRGGHGR